MEQKQNDKKKEMGALGALSLTFSIGITLFVTLGLCVLGGMWLDRYFDTNPWLTVVGIILGVVSSFSSIYKQSKRY